jgi:hypothetical protein
LKVSPKQVRQVGWQRFKIILTLFIAKVDEVCAIRSLAVGKECAELISKFEKIYLKLHLYYLPIPII